MSSSKRYVKRLGCSLFKLLQVGVFIISLDLGAQPYLVPPKVEPYFLNQGRPWVDSLMGNMTMREKIGQLFMVSAFSNRDEQHVQDLEMLIEQYNIGGVIFFQGGPVRQAVITNRLQEKSKTPLFVAMDAEWGVGMRLDSTISYPYQMGLGAIQDNDLIYEMGVEIGRQLARLGVQINFAPSIDVNNNPDNPVIGFRSFGEQKENVTTKGYQYMKGLQDAGLVVTAKHFPGHGDTGTDSHYDLPVLEFNRERLNELELHPFRHLVNRGVSGVMVAHMSIPQLDNTPNLPSTLSKPIVTDLLRNELGFNGLVFTDALNMKGVTKYFKPGEIEIKALQAGNDVMLYSENVPVAIEAVYQAVDKGTLTHEMIESKCRKVLSAKYFTGLSTYKPIEIEGLYEDLNHPKGIMVNRRLIESALTVLQNNDSIIPLGELSDLKIASVSIGKKGITPFQNMLEKYYRIDHFNLPVKPTTSEVAGLRSGLEDYDLVILGLHETRSRPFNSKTYGSGVKSFIEEIVSTNKSIVISFRNPYSLSRLPGIANAKALVTSYEDTPLHQELAAQLIFGAIGSKGRLSVSVAGVASVGDGIDTRGGIRLKYTLPEETGFNSDSLKKKIDQIALMGIDSGAYPGCQILISHKGAVIFHETYGYHTYEKTRPTKKSDIYDLASVTKVTAPLAALMKLHDQNKFKLDEPFGAYWSDFGWNRKNKLPMRDVLAHQSGLQAWIPYYTTTRKRSGTYKNKTLSPSPSGEFNIQLTDSLYLHRDYRNKIYRMIRKSPLNNDQGYVYSGLPFYLFPQIIENISGKDYESFLREEFYDPLGAITLTFNPLKNFPKERIVPTENDNYFRMTQLHGVVHDEGAAMMDGVSGNAGLFGSANDLAKMWQMYLNLGTYGGHNFISVNTMMEFTSCQFCEQGNRRGLGFDKPLIAYDSTKSSVARQATESSFGHSGYTGTFAWADPEHELLYIFLSNRVYPTRENRKLYTLSIRPKIHTIIYDEMGTY